MPFSFVKTVKVDTGSSYTPLNTAKLKSNGEKIQAHVAVVRNRSNRYISIGLDKSIVLMIVSFLFFLSGLGFWVYVNFFMS